MSECGHKNTRNVDASNGPPMLCLDCGIRFTPKTSETFKAPTYFTDDHARSMLLRDYFAAKAMQALIEVTPGGDLSHKWGAVDAYRYADAMLEARKE